MSERDPLAELGARLQSGMRAAEGRPWWRQVVRGRPLGRSSRRTSAVLVVAAALLGGGTAAVATLGGDPAARPAPVPDKLPPALRDGAVLPDRSGRAVFVADGVQDGVRWRLSAAMCDYGSRRAVGVFLTVSNGGGGARCDVAAQLPGADPAAIARRRVFTYYDASSRRTWVFGAVPEGARSVAVAGGTGPGGAVAARPAAGLPGLRVFLTTVPGARPAPAVRVLDARGAVLETCRDGRCPTPITGAP